MGCETKSVIMAWQGVSAIATAPVFVPAGGWMSAAGITAAKGWGELAGKTNQMQVTPAVQVANDIRSPGTATAVGQSISGNGVSDPNGSASVTTGSSKYIRPGWLVQTTSGTTLSTGNVSGVIEFIY
jgi:hypothetical protein